MFHRIPPRLRRWARRVLLTLAVLVVLVVAALVTALHSLDNPLLKTRVIALAHKYGGVDIDYRDARVRVLSGIDIDDLVVRSAPAFRDVAPELAHVHDLSVAWNVALLSAAVHLEKVSVSGLALTVASNANGEMSFDGLGPPKSKEPPPPSTPLSKQPGELLAAGIPAVDVTDVSFTLLRAAPAPERMSLRGVELHVRPETQNGASHVLASLGAPAAPLSLDLARERGGVASGDGHAKLWLTVDATAHDVFAALDVEVTKQSLVEHVEVARLLHGEAHAHFDDAAHLTTVTLQRTDVAAGVVKVSAALEVPDQGAPLVRHAEGQINGPSLLRLVPPELVPLRIALERGDVTFRADSLSLEGLPRLNEGANVVIDADLDSVRLTSPAVVDLAKGKLSVRVVPDGTGLKAHVSFTASGAVMPGTVTADDVSLDAGLTQSQAGALGGTIALGFGAIEALGAHVSAKDGKVTLKLTDLVLDPAQPLQARGDVAVDADVKSVIARGSGAARETIDQLALHAHSALTGKAPYALDSQVHAALVRVADVGGHEQVHAPLHADVKVEGVMPDAQQMMATPAVLHAVVDLGDTHVQAFANKTRDAVDYTLDVKATTLSAVRPFLAAAPGGPPLEQMAATVSSKGKLTALASKVPALDQHTELRVEKPSFGPLSAQEMALDLDSKGTSLAQEIHGEMRVKALSALETTPNDDVIAYQASFDRDAGTIGLHVEGRGRASAKLSVSLGFDRARRALTYDIDGDLGKLAPLAPLVTKVRGLEGFDLSQVEMSASGKGAVLGVVKSFDRQGFAMEPAPATTIAIDGTFGVRLQHFAYSAGSTSFSTPDVSVHLVLKPEGPEKRAVESHLQLGEFHLASGAHILEAGGLDDRGSLTVVGALSDPELVLEQRATVKTLKQDFAPTYPVGNALLEVSARRTRDGVLHIGKLNVENTAGATAIHLAGALDPTELQQRLSLRGDIKQGLAYLSNVPSRFAARGTANVDVRVESPDLTNFRLIGDVRVENASIWLPTHGIVVEDADGEIPVTLLARITPRGVRLVRQDQGNPYSSLRFADQHPLLRRSSFIKVRRLTLPQVQIAPLVGNLTIEQNFISLRQFEVGVRGGRVTGQLGLDWNGLKSTVDMHVRADSVQSSHGEPFTGNAALVISAGEHSIEGRADVLQIGERHLLDLLDLQDPFHSDPAMNKVRSALRFGYPDRLRVTFDHGFASVHVQFGGIARFISVGDLRGIPMGPLIDQVLTPFLPAKEEQ